MAKKWNIAFFKMSKYNIEPLNFIDTMYMPPEIQNQILGEPMECSTPKLQKPKLLRQITFLRELVRPLWQEDNNSISSQSPGFYSGDDEMDASPIKVTPKLPKITFNVQLPECAAANGIYRECQLSRKVEESYQSE